MAKYFIYLFIYSFIHSFNTPMGRFQLELIYLEVTSTPTRPVENVVLTTKGLQDRNNNVRWKDGGK